MKKILDWIIIVFLTILMIGVICRYLFFMDFSIVGFLGSISYSGFIAFLLRLLYDSEK